MKVKKPAWVPLFVKVKDKYQTLTTHIITDESFKKFGFSPAGTHHKWIKELEKMSSNKHNGALSKAKKVNAGTLLHLAYQYALSGGVETEAMKPVIMKFKKVVR